MKYLKGKIVHDLEIGVFYQSESETAVRYPEDAGSPLLKRLAPRTPRPYPPQPRKDPGQSDSEPERRNHETD